jgi:hypothetical protein
MRKHIASSEFSLLLLGLISWTPVAAADPPEARALIVKAIAAQGGTEALEALRATYSSHKGFDYQLNQMNRTPFQKQTYMQFPSQYNLTATYVVPGDQISLVQVLDSQRGWSRDVNVNQTTDVTGAALVDMLVDWHVEQVKRLTPLLTEESYNLSTGGQAQVNNQPADIVIVKKKGKPDVRLFFDATSHLLIKTEHKHLDLAHNKEVRREEYALDYRLVDPGAADLAILTAAKVESDGDALMAFLRKQTLDRAERKSIQDLIKKLGDDRFATREQAKTELVKRGARVASMVKQATTSADPEIANRAQECLQLLGKGPSAELLTAAIRRLAHLRPPGVADVLLDYIPSAPEETVTTELQRALAALAATDPKAKARLAVIGKEDDPAVQKMAQTLLKPTTPADQQLGYRLYPKGLKLAFKGAEFQDGERNQEWELIEIQFYSTLPALLFAKP